MNQYYCFCQIFDFSLKISCSVLKLNEEIVKPKNKLRVAPPNRKLSQRVYYKSKSPLTYRHLQRYFNANCTQQRRLTLSQMASETRELVVCLFARRQKAQLLPEEYFLSPQLQCIICVAKADLNKHVSLTQRKWRARGVPIVGKAPPQIWRVLEKRRHTKQTNQLLSLYTIELYNLKLWASTTPSGYLKQGLKMSEHVVFKCCLDKTQLLS